jgi:hypothetical protein
MEHLHAEGDGDVQRAVCNDFLEPELVCHHDLAWAMERMPPALAELCEKRRKLLERRFP